jgi:hypothetical protein
VAKFFKVMLRSTRDEETDFSKKPFSQKCPGGVIFQLVHTSAGHEKKACGEAVMIHGLTEKDCLSECEKKLARYTYFSQNAGIAVCPLQEKETLSE